MDTSTCTIPFRIEEQYLNNKEGIVIYPNPAFNYIHLKNTEERNIYRIFNITGQEVTTGRIGSNSSIYIQNLECGLYILQIKSNNLLEHIKFIKQDGN